MSFFTRVFLQLLCQSQNQFFAMAAAIFTSNLCVGRCDWRRRRRCDESTRRSQPRRHHVRLFVQCVFDLKQQKPIFSCNCLLDLKFDGLDVTVRVPSVLPHCLHDVINEHVLTTPVQRNDFFRHFRCQPNRRATPSPVVIVVTAMTAKCEVTKHELECPSSVTDRMLFSPSTDDKVECGPL